MIDSKETLWGLWATIGWGLIIAGALVFLQLLTFLGIVAIESIINLDIVPEAMGENLQINGFIVALAIFVTTPLCLGLIVLVIRLRPGLSVRRYLGFNPVELRTILIWLGVLAFIALISDASAHLVGRQQIPDFMIDAYSTAYFPPLFWIAFIVSAPLFEEVFFRGFLFRGFQHSELGSGGAVILTSLTWTILHVQYDAYILSIIFVVGIVFGLARLKTGSIYPPIAMHALFNLFAMVQLVAYFRS